MPGLYRTAEEKRQLETRNGAIQFLAVLHYVEEWKSGVTRLEPVQVLELQRLAINQIYTCAGKFRDGPVEIQGVRHKPPHHGEVPGLVDAMCGYINQNWDMPPIHLSSYVMWRVNWIHPFFGGNGRTARAVAYLVMCARLGFRLPGTKTIPELILDDRRPYYDALHHADEALAGGELNIGEMEALMSALLAKQLLDIHQRATGTEAQL